MGTAIELAEQRKVELSYLQTVGTVLAESHYFTDARTAEQAVAKILAGQEFGMGVMESMRSFHVIDGKVEMSADAQARLVKTSEKYDYVVVELTDVVCQITFWDSDSEIGTSTFTMGDAEKAGLLVKDSTAWKRYPRNMLFARALTNGVTWFCPDAIAGGRVYAPGEVSEEPWEVTKPVDMPVDQTTQEAMEGADALGAAVRGAAVSIEVSEPVEPVPVQGEERKSKGDGKAGSEDGDAAYGEGATIPREGGGSDHPSSSNVILSSQVKALLRLAEDLRWTDTDIAAALDERFTGLTELKQLTQAEARELIPEWQALARSIRITNEQIETIRTLVTMADAKTVAERLFGRKLRIADLTTAEGSQLIGALRDMKGAVGQ